LSCATARRVNRSKTSLSKKKNCLLHQPGSTLFRWDRHRTTHASRTGLLQRTGAILPVDPLRLLTVPFVYAILTIHPDLLSTARSLPRGTHFGTLGFQAFCAGPRKKADGLALAPGLHTPPADWSMIARGGCRAVAFQRIRMISYYFSIKLISSHSEMAYLTVNQSASTPKAAWARAHVERQPTSLRALPTVDGQPPWPPFRNGPGRYGVAVGVGLRVERRCISVSLDPGFDCASARRACVTGVLESACREMSTMPFDEVLRGQHLAEVTAIDHRRSRWLVVPPDLYTPCHPG
jgi:hypothetical protein